MFKKFCDRCDHEIKKEDSRSINLCTKFPGSDTYSKPIHLCENCRNAFLDWLKYEEPAKVSVEEEIEEVRKEQAEETDKIDIWDLKLSTRAYNALIKVGCKTVGQLCHMTESDVLGLKGIGKLAVDKIKDSLAELGRSLKKEENDESA